MYQKTTAGVVAGVTGLTVAVNVLRLPRATGSAAEIITGGSVVEAGRGCYFYRLADSDTTTYEYTAVFTASNPALVDVAEQWVEDGEPSDRVLLALPTYAPNVPHGLATIATDGTLGPLVTLTAALQALLRIAASNAATQNYINLTNSLDPAGDLGSGGNLIYVAGEQVPMPSASVAPDTIVLGGGSASILYPSTFVGGPLLTIRGNCTFRNIAIRTDNLTPGSPQAIAQAIVFDAAAPAVAWFEDCDIQIGADGAAVCANGAQLKAGCTAWFRRCRITIYGAADAVGMTNADGGRYYLDACDVTGMTAGAQIVGATILNYCTFSGITQTGCIDATTAKSPDLASMNTTLASVATDAGTAATKASGAFAGTSSIIASLASGTVNVQATNFVAPDNAGIAAIKNKTDNLPADPASNTQVNTRLAGSAYTGPDNAGVAAILDELPLALVGPSAVTVTFHDLAGNPVPLVEFSVGGGYGRANASGVAAFGRPDGDYVLVAGGAGLVLFEPYALHVAGDTAATVTGTAAGIAPPAAAGMAVGYVLDAGGAAGVTIEYQMTAAPGDDGYTYGGAVRTSPASSSIGLIQVTDLVCGAVYRMRRGAGDWIEEIPVPNAVSFALPEILGG